MANLNPEDPNVPNEGVPEEDPHHLLDYDKEEDPEMDIEEEEPEEDPGDQTPPPRDESSEPEAKEADDEPEAEEADDKLEVEEAGVEPEAEGADVELEAEEPDGGLAPWALRRNLEALRRQERIKEAELETSRTEVALMEQELYNLRMKGMDIDGYTNRFHELALLCPRMVEPEAVKVEQYIRGLAKSIRGDVTSSQPATINDAGHRKRDCPKLGRNGQGGNNHEGADRSFISTKFSTLINIKPVEIDTSYEVELADGKIARKYVENGCELFLAQVTGTVSKEKRFEDVPVIRDFPAVFLEDLLGLPPPRQVEFRIDLIPGATTVARAQYCLAPSELKELSEQLKEL
nr:putative reverse transcriptase domain-containing protein [Tanacetum cinerariifolium]